MDQVAHERFIGALIPAKALDGVVWWVQPGSRPIYEAMESSYVGDQDICDAMNEYTRLYWTFHRG